MERITTSLEELSSRCQQVLGEKGRLSTAIANFVPRSQQIELAVAIARVLFNQTQLVAEAGTGTGKTFSYLVPCLLSGKKIVISTATKTLQDQLVQKDLPRLIDALGLSVRIQNLKGRANYICRYRANLYAREGQFVNQQCSPDILLVHEKLPQLTHGERSELPEITEESLAWPYVTSTTDNCLGRECEHHQSCFLMKARKRALEADVVVINHHLFFADSQLKDEGFGELLPNAHAIIFDEAHQLAEIAMHFQGKRFSTRQLRDVMDDMLREWPVLDLANQPLKKLSFDLDVIIDQLLMSLEQNKDHRFSWMALHSHANFQHAWQGLLAFMPTWLSCMHHVNRQDEPGLARCGERLDELDAIIKLYDTQRSKYIPWLEKFKRTLVFHLTPFDIANLFNALLARHDCGYVFTSATLTMSDSFDCFIKQLGLINPDLLQLPSPFNFNQQAILYLPRGLPDPQNLDYYDRLLDKAVPVIQACGGRCFFLFTSHRALKKVANILHRLIPFPLLIQGEEAKPILLSRFRDLGNAVLLGTATFWEGVDVKGEALSCVIIDKLPFASPVDPVMRGRMNYLKEQGLSAFDELSLPNAVLALKQGVGRLIRDVSDKGVLMIADPRLTSREYGRTIFLSLPAMRKTRDEAAVLTFIQELGLAEYLSTA